MSEILCSKAIDLTDEANMVRTRFEEITGEKIDVYMDVTDVVSFMLDMAIHPPGFEKYYVCPFLEFASNTGLSSEYIMYIRDDANKKIVNKVPEYLDKSWVSRLKDHPKGFSVASTKMTGYSFMIDMVYNEREELCSLPPLNQNLLPRKQC